LKKTTASRIKSKSIDNDDQDSEDTLSILKKPKTSSNQSQITINSYFTHPLSKDNIDIIHESNSFKNYNSLKFCKDLTLIFDSWTTISNSSVYIFFAITSYSNIHILGLKEFEDQCHTSENIANITIEAINKIGLNIEQFSWIVTDSPNQKQRDGFQFLDNEIDSEEIYNIDDWDDNINNTLTSIELKDELEIFFEEKQAKLEDITNLTPKFIIEQLVDINDPIFYNQTVLNNFIDKSLVIDENNDSD
ncbi:3107_t:CDS:2, partial [Racocetra persica]